MLREVRTGAGALVASDRQGTKATPRPCAVEVRGRRPYAELTVDCAVSVRLLK